MAVLLQVVIDELTSLKSCIEEWCLRWRGGKPDPLLMEVLRMYGRAEEVLREFSGFYCLRLVLDKQSPLATYFMDFFGQMYRITHELIESPPQPTGQTQDSDIMEELLSQYVVRKKPSGLKEKLLRYVTSREHSQVWDVKKELLSPAPSWFLEREELIGSVHRLQSSLAPVVHTCFDLYAACQLSPTAVSKRLQVEGEFRREARGGRMFSENKFHCSMRSMGFVNLDASSTKVRLGKELGKGACGMVYEGHFEKGDLGQEQIGSPVAVKMFGGAGSSSSMNAAIQSWWTRMEHITSQPNIDRLDPRDEELRRLVSLQHPNIVRPKGYIGKRGQFGESGLVMELMDRSLHDFLEKVRDREEAPLDELGMIDLMLEIARGMRFIHECGLIHRDLKPHNVLLRGGSVTGANSNGNSKFAEVKLADFGITKDILSHHDDDELHTAPVGTNYYMAPEVRRSGTSVTAPYTDKADVFSYGTTCFNILIGHPAPDAYLPSKTGSIRWEHFYGAVQRGEWKKWVQQLRRNRYLVDLIERCWQTEASSRPTFASICLLLDVVKQSQLSRAPFHLFFPCDFVFLVNGSALAKRLRSIIAGKELIRNVLEDFETDYTRGEVVKVINKLKKDEKKLAGKLKDLDKVKVGELAVQAVLKPENLASRAFFFYSLGKRFSSGEETAYLGNSFDFASDEASTELVQDPSMIPLFVCFCSPFFLNLRHNEHHQKSSWLNEVMEFLRRSNKLSLWNQLQA